MLVFIDNDANCFAIRQRLYGKDKQYENFVGITIGTSISGGKIKTLCSETLIVVQESLKCCHI